MNKNYYPAVAFGLILAGALFVWFFVIKGMVCYLNH